MMQDSNLEIDSNAPRSLGKRKRTAESWIYFDLIIGEDSKRTSKCKKCGKEYPYTKSGTNTMRRHTEKCETKTLSSKAKKSSDEFMKAMAALMYDKFKKYWTNFSEFLAIAVILDPQYKMKFVEWCYEKVYGEMDGSLKVMELKEKLFSLFNEYGDGNSSFVSNSSSSSSQLVQGSENQGTSQYSHTMGASFSRETRILLSEFKHEVGVILQKSELEQYLEEPISDSNLNMDILTFWKGSELRYPRLASMARDILSIPISTVASESAFSAGGRVLDQYRSVLKPETVEALVCTKDWLYGSEELEKQNNLFEELTHDVLVMRREVNDEESCSSNTDSLSVIGHENRW